ncbi:MULTISPECIES: GNAT family N-acetyltransferase [Amycolatopsis]|uniref:GNAT family protein n=1 Tax=Amycolatopsis tucumanensis TaxID=401106 RepID=A0ABP7ITA6_9PSEU|nr:MULTISPECIES: GNAT family protein [Amycolatopsis]MCF6424703.1 GNAT family N-acetyltransferase [Amycolatopsis tucumanensis]
MLQPAYPLKTARLILRPFTKADLNALHSFQSRPDVTRYLYWEPRTRAETAAVLEDKIARSTLTEPGEYLAIAVELIDTGELIGDLTLWWTSREHASGEIGVVFHPQHHGKGYAAEAATELFRLGFDELGLHRIHGRCDSRNVASASLMEGLGMRREAHLRENELVKGEWTDELVYAMLSSEWKRR